MESISTQLRTRLKEKKIFKSCNLFKCILGLNELESNVFSYLLKHEYVTTIELANVLEKDRSSIQRSLQNLIKSEIIKRESMSLKDFTDLKGYVESHNRGYLYVYKTEELGNIKQKLTELLDQWYDAMLNTIDSLDSLFDCYEQDGELC